MLRSLPKWSAIPMGGFGGCPRAVYPFRCHATKVAVAGYKKTFPAWAEKV
ncbi:hypothetical protein LX69_01432, partial [Breznakibacter xylanolyticus]